MQLSGRDDFEAHVFPLSTRGYRPPKALVLPMLSLLNGEEPLASYAESEEVDGISRFYLYAVTTGRLIVVDGEGEEGWDWSSEPDHTRKVAARNWRLSSIERIDADDVDPWVGFNSETLWGHRLCLQILGEDAPLVIPRLTVGQDAEGPQEELQSTLLREWAKV